ncbi:MULTISPECIES: DUF2120 domain-containing protein [Methanothermobacter]|uniref:DUF2120 domain-containing protein n=1 Tax=Methanothermobacter marburgensis (strain ATCC BAA-927 / DSM 2133 / JCM 14651 / NBRC 100331 / OCM 82 / Marburg) TaxID=79929 RepID=D9PY56_METTM|nr:MULTISPECIES: DUF2120 domain-containing protein [Methanothermobacter]ADL59154.1 conserved hypothetical protein [Methanothermobacter marburgensis str. Marburg]
MKLHRIAGEIMGYFEAFEGSRPALDSKEILIVRGMSRKRMNIEDMGRELDGLIEKLGAEELELISEEGTALIGVMDEQIRSCVEVGTETDIGGIHRLKEALEDMNFSVDYRLCMTEDTGLFVVLYRDRSGVGPCFVEVVVSDISD